MSANYAEVAATEPRTQIASELDAMETEINYTEKIAAELRDRLYAAVCPRSEEAGGADKHPEPVRSPLGQALHDQKSRLERINEQLRRLMSSIELPRSEELGGGMRLTGLGGIGSGTTLR